MCDPGDGGRIAPIATWRDIFGFLPIHNVFEIRFTSDEPRLFPFGTVCFSYYGFGRDESIGPAGGPRPINTFAEEG
jgi:hypothetical protein